jgi:hypothetical protein
MNSYTRFTTDAPAAFTESYLTGGQFPYALFLFIGAGMALLFVAAVLSEKKKLVVSNTFRVTGLALVSAFFFLLVVGAISALSDQDAYAADVSEWLSVDYGIVLDSDKSGDLLNGESFVVDYDGAQTAISILETANGRLSVVDSQQVILRPVR